MTHQARYKAYYADRDAARYAKHQQSGLCRSGGCPRKAVHGKALCSRCRARNRAYARRHPYVRKGYPRTWSPLRRLFHEVGKENRRLHATRGAA